MLPGAAFGSCHETSTVWPDAIVSELNIKKTTYCCVAKSTGYDLAATPEGGRDIPTVLRNATAGCALTQRRNKSDYNSPKLERAQGRQENRIDTGRIRNCDRIRHKCPNHQNAKKVN